MKLHIGGMEKKEGWKIMNIQAGGEAGFSPNKNEIDFIGDITDLSQFDDNSIEEIYASHIIEHVPQKQVADTFKGIYRVLKDNGKFYVSENFCNKGPKKKGHFYWSKFKNFTANCVSAKTLVRKRR